MSRNARKFRIVSLGNDVHRDWKTFVAAFGGVEDFEVKILSQTIRKNIIEIYDNIDIVDISSNDELIQIYDWADAVVIPLMPNLHASGITVMQEAAVFGKPIVCSRVGGLQEYFDEDCAVYVPPRNPMELRAAVQRVAADPDFAQDIATKAQAKMASGQLSSKTYIMKHVDFSNELIRLS